MNKNNLPIKILPLRSISGSIKYIDYKKLKKQQGLQNHNKSKAQKQTKRQKVIDQETNHHKRQRKQQRQPQNLEPNTYERNTKQNNSKS